MKRIIIFAGLVAALLLSFAITLQSGGSAGSRHFLRSKAYRNSVHEDFEARRADGLEQFLVIPDGCTKAESEALEFLYAYMPLADAVDYTPEFYLRNVQESFRASKEMGWKVPEREFRHFVLPVRVNNENLDSSRTVFYGELKPRIKGLSMKDAILEVNHWCHEKVTYQPSDARTTSPLATMKNALGRCGEESTFCVAALRSVGIPARQVYTPRWAHTDDNHAWVEAWADGKWYFLGACEPEPVLNLGWFNAPASRAMLMHTKVFGKYDGPEEVVLQGPNYTEVNLTDNYARTAKVDFTVVDSQGTPVQDARVDFCIYNYAEFYPAVSKYTDADGRTFLSSGLGDLLVWASKDGSFGFAKASFGSDTEVTITIAGEEEAPEGVAARGFVNGRGPSQMGGIAPQERTFGGLSFEGLSLDIVPPPENVTLPEVTAEQREENNRRLAEEDAIRHAYEATFPTEGNEYVLRARGNWLTIEQFLEQAPDRERAEELLGNLSSKDLRDISLETLLDFYNGPGALDPRAENEFLWPYKGFFESVLTDSLKAELRNSEDVRRWVDANIELDDTPLAWRIPISPMGVWKLRRADSRSRNIFYVALSRTLGYAARINPVTGKVVSSRTEPRNLQGTLRLSWEPVAGIDNPKYYSHFTLSKLVDGRPQLLAFDEGEVDMGGGVDWANTFRNGCPIDNGRYLLVSGNRLSDGSVPVTMQFISVRRGETTVAPIVIRQPEDGVPVIGSFDSEQKFLPAGASEPVSLLSAVGRGYFVTALLEPGKEPTNHVLRDISAARSDLDAWGRPIVLLCETSEALSRLQSEIADGRYGPLPAACILGTVSDPLEHGSLPKVILSDTFNRVFFASEGYTIGLGDRLASTIVML